MRKYEESSRNIRGIPEVTLPGDFFLILSSAYRAGSESPTAYKRGPLFDGW